MKKANKTVLAYKIAELYDISRRDAFKIATMALNGVSGLIEDGYRKLFFKDLFKLTVTVSKPYETYNWKLKAKGKMRPQIRIVGSLSKRLKSIVRRNECVSSEVF